MAGTPPEGSARAAGDGGRRGRTDRQADSHATLALNNAQALGAYAPARRLAALGRIHASL